MQTKLYQPHNQCVWKCKQCNKQFDKLRYDNKPTRTKKNCCCFFGFLYSVLLQKKKKKCLTRCDLIFEERRWELFLEVTVLLLSVSYFVFLVMNEECCSDGFYILCLKSKNFCSWPNIWSRNSAPIDMAKPLRADGRIWIFIWVNSSHELLMKCLIEGQGAYYTFLCSVSVRFGCSASQDQS